MIMKNTKLYFIVLVALINLTVHVERVSTECCKNNGKFGCCTTGGSCNFFCCNCDRSCDESCIFNAWPAVAIAGGVVATVVTGGTAGPFVAGAIAGGVGGAATVGGVLGAAGTFTAYGLAAGGATVAAGSVAAGVINGVQAKRRRRRHATESVVHTGDSYEAAKFDGIDLNKDGLIDFPETLQYLNGTTHLNSTGAWKDTDVALFYMSMDTNRDGFIEPYEFDHDLKVVVNPYNMTRQDN